MRLRTLIDWRGNLVATVVGFGGQAVVRLLSSVILTRLLAPDAYGMVTIVVSITFMLELLADLNVGLFIIRDEHGEERRYIDTAWTMRFLRSLLNAAVLFLAAPLIATRIYDTPALSLPLQLISLCFVLGGLGSMGFTIAVRRNNARVIVYSELVAAAATTAFTILYTYISRDFWGLIYGIMLNRALNSAMSHLFYREFSPRFSFDWAAAKEILQFTKYTMPSSLVTIGLTQFDKVALLRLFDLSFLGVYGVAGNISGPIESLIGTTSQRVLYPRCARNFREFREQFTIRYYTENIKLFALILFLPAALLGASKLVITFLYDTRYSAAAAVLQAFALRSILTAFQSAAEDALIAAGASQVILYSNINRAVWIICASLLGFHFFGFLGFAYGVATCPLPAIAYLWWLQRKKGIIIFRYEMLKIAFAVAVAATSFIACHVFMAFVHVSRLKLG